jgi:hypothetical protein
VEHQLQVIANKPIVLQLNQGMIDALLSRNTPEQCIASGGSLLLGREVVVCPFIERVIFQAFMDICQDRIGQAELARHIDTVHLKLGSCRESVKLSVYDGILEDWVFIEDDRVISHDVTTFLKGKFESLEGLRHIDFVSILPLDGVN